MFSSFLGFLFKALPAGEVHAHGGGGDRRGKGGLLGKGGSAKSGSKKEEVKKLETRIKRQAGVLKRMSPSNYSRREIQIENESLSKFISKKKFLILVKIKTYFLKYY